MHAEHPEIKTIRRSRWHFFLGAVALILIALLLLGYFQAHRLAQAFIQSPSGQRAASTGLSKTIKIDGKFQPLKLEGWTIKTESFHGPGWPGEALGGIDAHDIRAEFDPSAILHRAWRISGIQIDHATIELKPPNDALKRPVPPKRASPWYSMFLPNRFECGPIIVQHAALDFSFQKQTAQIKDAHVQADLIGKDLKYTATSGLLYFPYLPPLRIIRLEMLVTRRLITISTAQLTAVDPTDPARATLSGKLGMRENKAINATVEVIKMPIEQILPENLKALIHGRASGKLVWTRDSTGQQVSSEGNLSIINGSIDDLSVFRQLTPLHGNPDLKSFSFSEATCHFRLQGSTCTLDLRASAPGKFDFTGTVSYEFKSKIADLDVNFRDLPLQTWLPPEFKPQSSGYAQASLKWQGQLDTIKNSSGTAAINLNGAEIHLPSVLRRALAPKHLRAPEQVQFEKAEFALNYSDRSFQLTKAELAIPKIVNAQLQGNLTADASLNATMDWQGLTIQDWLPAELADQFSGDINGHANLQVHKWKLGAGAYVGDVTLLNGDLRYTSVQSLLARFANDRTLLNVPLTHAHFFWMWNQDFLSITQIDLRGRNELGVKGALRMTSDRRLSGTLWIGMNPTYLKSLGGAADAIFSRREDGLVWAKVTVSGTTQKPEQDLTAQVFTQLKHRPWVVLGLGFRLASWYIGNAFGVADEWKRPSSRLSGSIH